MSAAELEAAVGDEQSGLAVLEVARQEWEWASLVHTKLAFEFTDQVWTVVEQALAKFAAEKCASDGTVCLRDADAVLRFGKHIARSMGMFHGDYLYLWDYELRTIEMRRGGRGTTDDFIQKASTLISELGAMVPAPQTELLSANDPDPPPSVVLAPKREGAPEYTLALDLDDTLHQWRWKSWRRCKVGVRSAALPCIFGARVQVCIFTHAERTYADAVLDQLDPGRALISHRLYREHCSAEQRKDLRILGRDLTRIVAIDDTPEWFGLQAQNCLPIKSWYRGNWHDRELLKLVPFLEALAIQRPLIHWRTGINVAHAHAKFALLGAGYPAEAATGGQKDLLPTCSQQSRAARWTSWTRLWETSSMGLQRWRRTYAGKLGAIVERALEQFALEKCGGMELNSSGGMSVYALAARLGSVFYEQPLGRDATAENRMHFHEGILHYMDQKVREYHCYTEEARRIVQQLEQVPALDAQQLRALLAKENEY